MSISMLSAGAALHARLLENLLTWLDKAEAHATARGFPSSNYLGLRLAPDMFPLSQQVVIACEVARLAAARLAGIEMPPWSGGGDDSLQALGSRVRDAIAFLRAVTPQQVQASATREIEHPQRMGPMLQFTGETFLQRWATPNFFFHITTTYALLRHAGVDLGKADYLGAL